MDPNLYEVSERGAYKSKARWDGGFLQDHHACLITELRLLPGPTPANLDVSDKSPE